MRLTEKVPVPDNWQTLRYHRLSALSGFGVGIDLDALVAHMRANGYDDDEPIILYDGEILDGRHKHTAAIHAEVTPTFRLFIGADPVAFVTKKILRQHFNESQRALFAAALAKLPRGGDRGNQHTGGKGSIDPLPTRAEAAEMLNVSEKAVARAKKVLDHGTPKLQEAVADGTLSLSDAATVATEPAKVQNRAVKEVLNGHASTVTAAVQESERCASCQRKARVGQPVPKNCPECKGRKEPEPEPEPVKDKLEHIVPPRVIPSFETLAKFEAADSLIRSLQKTIDEISRLPGGEQLRRFLQATGNDEKVIYKSEHLNCLKRDLNGTRPYSVCPHCMGKGNCTPCGNRGWFTKISWDQTEKKLKEKMACSN